MNEVSHTLLHLSLIEDVGPVTIQRLCSALDNVRDIYSMRVSDIQFQCSVSYAVAQKIVQGLADERLLHNELELIEKNSIAWCTLVDQEYPTQLATIHAPPPVLYWRGAHPNSYEQAISCVGSRKSNSYAHDVLHMLIPQLVSTGWSIVSGGALGVDSLAHKFTLKSKGKTCAVIGSGLCYPYPTSNKGLFDAIIECGGTVLSPFPCAMQAVPGNFPARNRIIAGMSKGCIVVQAAQKSGALITAQFALEQSREVFAIPGSIFDPLSQGCHDLLSQGAHVCTGINDVMSVFGMELNKQKNSNSDILGARKCDDSPEGKLLVACSTPQSMDDLAGLFEDQQRDFVQNLLWKLQIEGVLRQNFAGLWERAF